MSPEPGGSPAARERRRTIPREQDAPRPLIALMIALMLAGVVGAYTALQRTSMADHLLGRPTPQAREGLIFTVDEILAEPVKANLLGRDVAIWGARVAQVTGDWLFWIGADSANAVPAILLGEQTGRQPEGQTVVRAGDIVAVFGTIHAVRDVSLLEGSIGLGVAERERLLRARVYVSSLRVETLARAEAVGSRP
jgi:hypothetical protein